MGGGLDGDDMARLVYLGALALFIGAGFFASRQTLSRDLKAFAFWIAALALLVAIYGFKDDAKLVFQRFAGTLAPGLAVEAGGEISVARSRGGMFVLSGTAEGARMSFMFDTGASAVVLTSGDASRAGFNPKEAEFSVTTLTANGATTVAPVTIRELVIGSIAERDVRAFVARPGALNQSLLGQTFLNRLKSYEVRGDRLILRP
jgi:aspartyl protease family protein